MLTNDLFVRRRGQRAVVDPSLEGRDRLDSTQAAQAAHERRVRDRDALPRRHHSRRASAATLFPQLAKGRLPVVGNGANRMPLIHVEDAARALVHLSKLSTEQLTLHPWIVTDGSATTQRELLELGAKLLGGPQPKSVPRWLASLVAGRVGAASFSRDVPIDPSALVATGFTFRFPTIATGLPVSIAHLELAA